MEETGIEDKERKIKEQRKGGQGNKLDKGRKDWKR